MSEVKVETNEQGQEMIVDNTNVSTTLDTKVNKKVAEAWSKKVGRKINFELLEVEAADGRKQTQLINPEEGSVVVAVNATGSDAVDTLVERAGDIFIDPAFDWYEIQGKNKANQVNKSDISVETPADGPGAAIEAKKGKNADKLSEDQ